MQLALSTGRHVDGIWIGSYRTPEDLTRRRTCAASRKNSTVPCTTPASSASLSEFGYSCCPRALAEYNHSLRACVLDERYVADSATSVEQIASIIVHEATHARLERRGIRYKEELRAEMRRSAFVERLTFAVRLPDSAQLQEDRAQDLNWYQANPDYFHDAHFIERHTKGEVEVLRHIGVPDWLIRAMPTLQSMIGRARRLFHIAWPLGQ